MNNNETELRFLVKGYSWKKSGTGIKIKQRYISLNPRRIVRVRIYGKNAFMTVKGEKKGDSNPEFEWKIRKKQAEEMFQIPSLFEGYPILKMRYKIPAEGINWKGEQLVWDLDEFHAANDQLRIAEIELPHLHTAKEKQQLTNLIFEHLPVWIGDHLDYNSDPSVNRYFNANLAKRPFSHWSSEEKQQMLYHLQ